MKWLQRLAFLAVGGIAAGVFVIVRLPGILPQIQLIIPGDHELMLDRVGEYTIFWEPRSTVDGEIHSSEGFSGLSVTVTSAESGRELELDDPSASMTYTTGARSGQSVASFVIETPGTYTLSATTGDESQIVLAVGEFPLLALMAQSLGVFLLFAGGGYLGIRRLRRRGQGH